jgi:galactan 5-O-arabinofuranosyltransferase
MTISLKKIAPWLLLVYTFFLCYLITQLPFPFDKFKELNFDMFPRMIAGICVITILFIYYQKTNIDSYVNKEWIVFNLFILLSFSSLFILFRGATFGLNVLTGDAYFNAAMVAKYKYFNSLTDFNYIQLSTSYPALYHFILGKYAALFNIESYTAIYHGYFITFCIYSIPLFLLIKRVAGTTTATAFIIFYFFNFPIANLYKPYEFISACFFLFWWIYFVEEKFKSTKFSIIGGLIGAAIFMTYYYWFFIAAIYLATKLTSEIATDKSFKKALENRKGTIITLATAAIFSSIYWIPLAMEFSKFGMESLQNMWMTPDMAEFNFLHEKSIVVNIILGIGVALPFLYKDDKVMTACRWLLIALTIWFTLGYLMLYLSKPTVTSKIHYLAYAVCALSLFNWLFNLFNFKSLEIKQKAIGILFVSLFIVSIDNFLEIKNHSLFKNSVSVQINPIQKDETGIKKFKNKVLLTDRQHINALIPVHTFMNINAHFSHPASQFRKRIAFLQDLQQIQNPEVLAWFLAYNNFDKVDLVYFSNSVSLTIFDDNYPRGHSTVSINLSNNLFNSQYLKPFDQIDGEQGVIFELIPPPFDAKNSFSQTEIELANKYSKSQYK